VRWVTHMRRSALEVTVAMDAVQREIAARIRRVCAHFEESDFLALVHRMAEIEIRYRLRDDWLSALEPMPETSSVVRSNAASR